MGAFVARRQIGFTYLGLLFFVAISGAALAGLGQLWSTAAQRERERELEFRGEEIARAIARYAKATPSGMPRYPNTLEDLLLDVRGPKPLHHLRRLYTDPFSGKPDWVLMPEASQPGAFSGVRSREERALLRQTAPDGSALETARDWHFLSMPHERGSGQDGTGPAVPVQPVDPGASAPLAG